MPPPVVASAPTSSPLLSPLRVAGRAIGRMFDRPEALDPDRYSGRLLISNFAYEQAIVEALVTPYPDCAVHPGVEAADMPVPLNGTWTIPTQAGWDVCWRTKAAKAPMENAQDAKPPGTGPVGWNRAYTGNGRFIEAQL